jgi:hypothetical protein
MLKNYQDLTRGAGKCQHEWNVTHVCRRSPENQPGPEGTMGEAEGSHTILRGRETRNIYVLGSPNELKRPSL